MAMTSVSCALAISQTGWEHGRAQQQLPDERRGRICGERTNCRAWRATRVASSGTGRLECRLNRRRADFITVLLPSQSKAGRIATLSRLDDEFQEGADIDDVVSETSAFDDNEIQKGVQVDLQLPRRRLLVEFTCNVCQKRTQRLVNPEAYKRGTVYVQCGGCEAYHQLVDNLGLVAEHDFRKETDSNPS